jgi:hypothetical protein
MPIQTFWSTEQPVFDTYNKTSCTVGDGFPQIRCYLPYWFQHNVSFFFIPAFTIYLNKIHGYIFLISLQLQGDILIANFTNHFVIFQPFPILHGWLLLVFINCTFVEQNDCMQANKKDISILIKLIYC